MRRQRYIFAAVFLAQAVILGVAYPERLLVQTASMTVGRAPAQLYLQAVDLETGEVSPASLMPGADTLGPLLVGPTGISAVGTTMTAAAVEKPGPLAWTFINVFRTSPLNPIAPVPCMNEWRSSPACTMPNGDIVTTGWRIQEQYGLRGCMQYLSPDHISRSLSKPIQFAGKPTAAVPVDNARVAVLCENDLTQACQVHVIDLYANKKSRETIEIVDTKAISGSVPTALHIMPGQNILLALTSARIADSHGIDTRSWLHVLDLDRGREVGQPLEMPGMADSSRQSVFPSPTGCWIATRPSGTDYAYLTRAAVGDSGAVQAAQIPIGGVTDTFVCAASGDAKYVAISMGNRLEIRADTGDIISQKQLVSPITSLFWAGPVLVAGASNKVHFWSDLSSEITKTVELQSGWVTNLALIPDHPEATPGPLANAAPRLQIPPVVLFHGESTGQEIKAIKIDLPSGPARWSVSYDATRMPWLVANPPAGTSPSVLYMGVDPSRYTPPNPAWGWLNISIANGPSERVLLGIVPEERSEIRRILWLSCPGSEENRLRMDKTHPLHELAEMLSSPPNYFAHIEAAGPYHESLDSTSVVVLPADAALRGSITRPALLNYVVNGGSLLFLGSYQPEVQSGEAFMQWLAPADIQMDASVRVAGKFGRAREHWLTRHWTDFDISDGCAFYTNGDITPLVGTERQAVFVTATYGQGRIAALAAPTPLENAAMASEDNRQFAADLFRWLSGAGRGDEYQDMDGDRLPDATEDRNQNGAVDPGETNYLDPDTDGDGVPDGLEDSDCNGRVDEDETSALVADTDGDGVNDGADSAPLPPTDAPFISAVTPASGPVEGGTLVMISGRNFTPDVAVSFGGRNSANVRQTDSESVIAEAPPQEEVGKSVDVRVYSPASETGYIMPEAYCYTERSEVGIVAHAMAAMRAQEAIYSGVLTLTLRNPEHAFPNRIVLILNPDPQGKIEWRPEKPERGAIPAMVRESHGRLIVAAARSRGRLMLEGKIAEVPFTCRPGDLRQVHVKVETAGATAGNGQALNVSMADFYVPIVPAPDIGAPSASGTISP